MIDPAILGLYIAAHERREQQFAPPGLTRHQLASEPERTTDQDGAMLYQDLGGES